MWAMLLLAVFSLAAWPILVLGLGVQSGSVHLLLAVGTTCLVRWWALRG